MTARGEKETLVRTLRSAIVAVTAFVLVSASAVAHDVLPPRSPAEVCDPADIPFDPEDIRLTGRWAATDGGMYYVRQVGDTIWWNGMSDYAQKYGEIGRDFNNVGRGTLVGDSISAEFADVPRGNIWGNGNLSLRVESDAEGNLQVRRASGDFGGDIFRPCAPEVRAVTEFARPFTYQVPFGMGSVTWPGTPDQKVVMSAEEPDAGLTVWVVGPGWATVCSVPPGTPIPTDHSSESVLAYLRAHPDLEVSEATATTVDGRPALSVDITTADGASGCGGDGYVRFWKQSGFEGGLAVGASTHLVLLDVDGATVAFEVWDTRSSTWLPRAQEIIESVRFDADAATGMAVGEPTDDGARIVRVDVLDERTRDLTIESPSVGYARVRLLLPDGFDESTAVAWPTLYLLHGAEDDYRSWTRETDVAAIEELRNVLVVMPDAGRWGWYSDWSNRGDGGQPAWETFHTEELPRLLERDWGASPNRVVAGLSMGGFGALSYAARHPGFYNAAAAYSGVVDTVGSDFESDLLLWGDKVADAETWEAHNPLSQAEALAGTPLYISYGDGDPGPLDPDGAAADGLEGWLASQNDALVARLQELGIPATVDAYGDGTHSWPYWERGLHDSLPLLLGALGEPTGGTGYSFSPAEATGPGLTLVAVGDSIPFNSPDDCPGCTGFVDLYADALASATGETVSVRNLSEHNNQVVDGLLTKVERIPEWSDAISSGDAILVGIAHNDVPWNRSDDTCNGPADEVIDWTAFTDECIAAGVERFTPKYLEVFSTIAALRGDKPTILRTINRYNDWIGWTAQDLPPEATAATARVIAAWNSMICGAAEASGFLCADISTRFNGPDGTQPSGDLLAGDYTHPSEQGNEAIAQVLVDLGFAPLAG